MKDLLSPLSEKARNIKKGHYQHYKGNNYQFIGVCRHSETLEEMVIYHSLDDPQQIWVRPLDLFCDTVILKDDQIIPRFSHLS